MSCNVPRLTHVLLVLTWLAPVSAHAAATCSFDPATATVTVDVGGATANLVAVKVSGQIRLNATACGAATVYNTDAIQVNGTTAIDNVNLTGSFTPGLTPETDGSSEIEISFALAGGGDSVTVYLGSGNNRLTMTASGIDVGDDLDEDITIVGIHSLVIEGEDGNDIIDASAYTGAPRSGRVTLDGGPGNDRITGTEKRDLLYGGEGDDTLYGLGERDRLTGGPGNDSMFGGAGYDEFWAEPTLDGADIMRGGADGGQADYSLRTAPLNLTLGNGLADDGEAGEGDSLESDVDGARGGSGDDVIIGSARGNSLSGGPGNDEIHGGPGMDGLFGDGGDDTLFGDGGRDTLYGDNSLDEAGNDVLTGGDGADTISGQGGDDLIFNADGFADEVFCGEGFDDPEPDPLDTFNQCEAI